MKRPKCYMCKKRPAVPLTASRDGQVYVNAENVTMFCSLRCAANYALLWGVPTIEMDEEYNPETEEWEPA